MFNLLKPQADIHRKMIEILLREAQLASTEHQAAAEHHSALSRMYSERIIRLQAGLREASPNAECNPAQTDQQVPDDPPIIHGSKRRVGLVGSN